MSNYKVAQKLKVLKKHFRNHLATLKGRDGLPVDTEHVYYSFPWIIYPGQISVRTIESSGEPGDAFSVSVEEVEAV